MKRHSLAYYRVYRSLLSIAIRLYLRFGYRLTSPLPRGPKIIVGDHPTVWDAFTGIVAFKHDLLHALIGDQIWSLSVARLVLSLTNQVKSSRPCRPMDSGIGLREALT